MVTYSATDPADYLEQLDDDWRRITVLELRARILEAAPDWVECIHYKMLGYGPKGDPVLHLNAQKKFVGLYVGNVATIDPDGTLLGKIDCGKGCVRFAKKDQVGQNIAEFLAHYVALKRQGVNFEC